MWSRGWLIGADADHLVSLPMPARGLSRSPSRVAGIHTSLSGSTTMDVVGFKRAWSLGFTWLDNTEYDLVLSFVDGRRGLGPFVLNDPGVAGGARFTVLVTGLSADTETLRKWHDCTLELQEV